MKHRNKQYTNRHQAGFTLIETVIAILILSLSIGALLTLSAGGLFSVRYARNQIVADNLAQEGLEFLRNYRDTASIREVSWTDWTESLPSGCFQDDGCRIDPYTEGSSLVACSGACPGIVLYQFPDAPGFYGYSNGDYPFSTLGVTQLPTTYVRTIRFEQPDHNQLVVTSTITWRNGNATKTVSQSLLLTNWNI